MTGGQDHRAVVAHDYPALVLPGFDHSAADIVPDPPVVVGEKASAGALEERFGGIGPLGCDPLLIDGLQVVGENDQVRVARQVERVMGGSVLLERVDVRLAVVGCRRSDALWIRRNPPNSRRCCR